MDNSKNMEPGIKDTAAFDSTNKESKKKESRPVISAKAQTILEFLAQLHPLRSRFHPCDGGLRHGKWRHRND